MNDVTREELLKEAEAILRDYDEAMASQPDVVSNAKLIVIANYGELGLQVLRALLRRQPSQNVGDAEDMKELRRMSQWIMGSYEPHETEYKVARAVFARLSPSPSDGWQPCPKPSADRFDLAPPGAVVYAYNAGQWYGLRLPLLPPPAQKEG